jgi:hypothetical protein
MPSNKSTSSKSKNKKQYHRYLKAFNRYCEFNRRDLTRNEHIQMEFSMFYKGWNFPVGFSSPELFHDILKTAKRELSSVKKRKKAIKHAQTTLEAMLTYSEQHYDIYNTGEKLLMYNSEELMKIWGDFIKDTGITCGQKYGELSHLSVMWHTACATLLEAGILKQDKMNGWQIQVTNTLMAGNSQHKVFFN